ncbi:MAG: DUF4124 domain-containing protein, partial [Methylococcaceae bacterium]|nr:DUF4124 domain-containing protein [Methylococcaceae bacterium]
MKQHAFLSKSIFLIALSLACTHQPAYAKKMYKWVDEDGKVFFSDKIPPTQKHLKRESLDKNAQVIQVFDKAKTKAQLDMDKRLQALRRQQETLVAAQKQHDKVLRSSFRNLEDMKVSHAAKLRSFDDHKKALEEKKLNLEKELAALQKKAADADINNKAVSEETLKNIEDTQKNIEQVKLDIELEIEKKKKTEKKFAVDRTRYTFITKTVDTNLPEEVEAVDEIETAVNQLGLFSCESEAQCVKAWNVARRFVEMNSTTSISIDTDKLIMTEDPRSVTDLSLSVSKMAAKNKNMQIFLDIRCRDTVKGQALCEHSKAESLRAGFSDFIKAALGLETDKQKQAKVDAAKAVKEKIAADEAAKAKAEKEK